MELRTMFGVVLARNRSQQKKEQQQYHYYFKIKGHLPVQNLIALASTTRSQVSQNQRTSKE
jgi:hypothetical protein